MTQPAFSNSMSDGNYPDDLQTNNDAGSDAESRGGDHRPVQDNTSATYNVQGQANKVDYPLPPDPNAPPGPDASDQSDDEVSDYGLNEGVEVSHDTSVADFGFGGSAGGGGRKTTQE